MGGCGNHSQEMYQKSRKSSRGYRKGGKLYKKRVGSKASVFHGNAHQTKGGTRKTGLKRNPKTKRIVFKKKSINAKKNSNLIIRNSRGKITRNYLKDPPEGF